MRTDRQTIGQRRGTEQLYWLFAGIHTPLSKQEVGCVLVPLCSAQLSSASGPRATTESYKLLTARKMRLLLIAFNRKNTKMDQDAAYALRHYQSRGAPWILDSWTSDTVQAHVQSGWTSADITASSATPSDYISKLLANFWHGSWPCASPKHHWLTTPCLIFQPYTQKPFQLFREGSRRLIQEILALAGALALTLPPPRQVFTFRDVTSHRFVYTVMAPDRSNAISLPSLSSISIFSITDLPLMFILGHFTAPTLRLPDIFVINAQPNSWS
jgi:hypothetical protein